MNKELDLDGELSEAELEEALNYYGYNNNSGLEGRLIVLFNALGPPYSRQDNARISEHAEKIKQTVASYLKAKMPELEDMAYWNAQYEAGEISLNQLTAHREKNETLKEVNKILEELA